MGNKDKVLLTDAAITVKCQIGEKINANKLVISKTTVSTSWGTTLINEEEHEESDDN